ncbi:MAG: TOBE domain-containing protein [Rhodospirillales bacterium]|nr:TOBE domain-containing protein [Rhodospirillales bacterium]
MRLSARNVFQGKVVSVNKGAVNATVKVDIGGGNVITSMVTMEAVDELGVTEGAKISVVVKASSVMLAA